MNRRRKRTSRIDRRAGVIAAAGAILFTLTACHLAASPVPEASRTATDETRLSWLVCVGGLYEEEDFFAQNRIGRLLAEAMGEAPELTYSAQDAVSAFSQRIASGTLPDVFTAEAQDEVLRLCQKDAYTYDLRDAVPDALAARMGTGHGVPGGFSGDTAEPRRFSEGIYVRRRYLADKRVYDQQAFITLVKSNSRQSVREPGAVYPILLDTGSAPFATLEHLFGIRPLYAEAGRTGHRIFEQNWPALLTFLQQLQKATGCTSLRLPSDEREALLDAQVHVYIGRHDPVAYANRTLAPEEQFVPIYPDFNDQGFLQVYSRQGSYRTFVCRNGRDTYARAVGCLKALLTVDAGRTAILGEANRDWVFDDSGQRPVLLDGGRSEEEALREGALRFPFLSTVGLGEKGYEAPLQPFDVLEMTGHDQTPSPDAGSPYVWSFEQKIQSVLQDAMVNRNLRQEDLMQKLQELRESEELMCLHTGLP